MRLASASQPPKNAFAGPATHLLESIIRFIRPRPPATAPRVFLCLNARLFHDEPQHSKLTINGPFTPQQAQPAARSGEERPPDLRAQHRCSGRAGQSRRRSVRTLSPGRGTVRQAPPGVARLPAACRGRRDQAADGADAAGLGEVDLHVDPLSRARHGPLCRQPGDRRQLRRGAAAQMGTESAQHRAAEGLRPDLPDSVVEGERRRRRMGAHQRLRIHGRGRAHRHHRQPRRRRGLGRPDQGARPGGLASSCGRRPGTPTSTIC